MKFDLNIIRKLSSTRVFKNNEGVYGIKIHTASKSERNYDNLVATIYWDCRISKKISIFYYRKHIAVHHFCFDNKIKYEAILDEIMKIASIRYKDRLVFKKNIDDSCLIADLPEEINPAKFYQFLNKEIGNLILKYFDPK